MTPDEIRETFAPKPGMPASIFPPSLKLEVEKAVLFAEMKEAIIDLTKQVKELIEVAKRPSMILQKEDEPKVNLRKTNVG